MTNHFSEDSLISGLKNTDNPRINQITTNVPSLSDSEKNGEYEYEFVEINTEQIEQDNFSSQNSLLFREYFKFDKIVGSSLYAFCNNCKASGKTGGPLKGSNLQTSNLLSHLKVIFSSFVLNHF